MFEEAMMNKSPTDATQGNQYGSGNMEPVSPPAPPMRILTNDITLISEDLRMGIIKLKYELFGQTTDKCITAKKAECIEDDLLVAKELIVDARDILGSIFELIGE